MTIKQWIKYTQAKRLVSNLKWRYKLDELQSGSGLLKGWNNRFMKRYKK